MKKLFISILFLLSASAVVDAQEKKNDISVMYGLGSLHYFLTSSMRHPNSFFIVYHVKKRFDCLMFFRQE